MTSTKKDPVLVVFQLSGGNDYLNTVIPYANPIYRDARPRLESQKTASSRSMTKSVSTPRWDP